MSKPSDPESDGMHSTKRVAAQANPPSGLVRWLRRIIGFFIPVFRQRG
jgi:hypothetical protein